MTRSRDVADTQDNLGGAVAPFVAGKNVIINGNFDIWQRGTSFTGVLDVYVADRWSATRAGTTINLTVTQDTSVPNTNSKYSMKFQQVTTGASAITEYAARQAIEQNNLLPILGKSATVSFWYRSNKTGSHGIRIIGVNTGGTDQVTSFTVNVADTWEYKTVAVTAFAGVSSANLSPTAAAGYVDIGFRVGGTGAGFTTLSANDYFQISQTQLELGAVATPFSRAGGSIGGELALCQRYYLRYTQSTAYERFGNGFASATNAAVFQIPLKVTLRVAATSVEYSGMTAYDGITQSGTGVVALNASSANVIDISLTSITGLVTYRPYAIIASGTSGAYFAFSAEL